jgi:hypothetical protein
MELNFQVIVLIIAIVLLILTLIGIGAMLRRSKMSQQWPPVIGKCPDYWETSDPDGNICTPINPSINTGSTGSDNVTSLDLTQYTNNCQLYDWASSNNITWDGITLDGSMPAGC